jgi:hypothetical protein
MSKLFNKLLPERNGWFFRVMGQVPPANEPDQEDDYIKRKDKEIDGKVVTVDTVFVNGGLPDEDMFKKLFRSTLNRLESSDKARESSEDEYTSIKGDIYGGHVTLSTDEEATNRDNGDTAKYSRVPKVSQLPTLEVITPASENYPAFNDLFAKALVLTSTDDNNLNYQLTIDPEFIDWMISSRTLVERVVLNPNMNDDYIELQFKGKIAFVDEEYDSSEITSIEYKVKSNIGQWSKVGINGSFSELQEYALNEVGDGEVWRFRATVTSPSTVGTTHYGVRYYLS